MQMPTRNMGQDNDIPMIGLGTWKLQGAICEQVVKDALDLGYNHIDTADIYKNHESVGKAVRGLRPSIFLVSKLWYEDHDANKVEESLDRCLKELQTDYLDLYLLHWPNRKRDICGVIHEMRRMQEKGKVKAVGACNMTIHHVQDLLNQGLSVDNLQVELHPFLVQEELVHFCAMQDIIVTAYSPLARGKVMENKLIQDIATKHNTSPAAVALAWGIHKGFVVIPKASSRLRLEENLGALTIKLTESEVVQIQALDQNMRLVKTDFQEFDY